jgi:hypothetical protein
MQNKWIADTKRCFIDECAHTKDTTGMQITIDYDTWRVLCALTTQIKSEWQAFLTGRADISEIYVTGYWIPKQRVTNSTVENIDEITEAIVQEKNIVASIHSHADMGVFHSSVDMESTCRSAWVKHHITINNKLETVAKSQAVLPCGRISFVDSKVVVVGAPQEICVTGIENIEKKTAFYNWETADAPFTSYNTVPEYSILPVHVFGQTRLSQGEGLSYV